MSRGTVNKAIIIGRLGQDPDMRYSPGGTAIASFSVATNHGQKDAEGSWTDKTEWHNIVTFGKTAEFVGEYLKKGKLVYLEGRLQTSSWEDQQGQKKYKTEIIALNLQLLGSKGDSESTYQDEPASDDSKVSEKPSADDGHESDDLPF
ncbi:MAG: single-stranded DNA-binding protein [Calditrichaceae bacterium]